MATWCVKTSCTPDNTSTIFVGEGLSVNWLWLWFQPKGHGTCATWKLDAHAYLRASCMHTRMGPQTCTPPTRAKADINTRVTYVRLCAASSTRCPTSNSACRPLPGHPSLHGTGRHTRSRRGTVARRLGRVGRRSRETRRGTVARRLGRVGRRRNETRRRAHTNIGGRRGHRHGRRVRTIDDLKLVPATTALHGLGGNADRQGPLGNRAVNRKFQSMSEEATAFLNFHAGQRA